jgi:O-antigen ligase
MKRRLHLMLPVPTFKSVQLWATIAALTLAPLFFGSVDLFWVATWTILLSIGALCGLAVPTNSEQSRILLGFFALCSVYAVVAIIQITPNLIDQLNDPAWRQMSGLLNVNTLPRISSRAEIPALAVGHFLLFATSFISGFFVGTSKRRSDRLVQFAQYSILIYALYGIAALVFTPDRLLWASKVSYLGYLTATFVNHNTAATFIGAGAILWFCLAFSSVQSLRLSTLRMLLLSRTNEALAMKIILRSAAALTCLFGLLLTGSRGGLVCSAMGLLAAMILMAVNKWRLTRWRILALSVTAFALTSIWVIGIGRFGSQGLIDNNRLSVYASSIRAIKERPFFGAGAGTFSDMFPAFRDSDLWTWGVWDYAHSTLLEIAFEMGIPVAASVAAGALASVFILMRAAATASERVERRVLAAITGIATLSYLHSMIDFSLQIPGYFVVFGILLGCGLARASAARTESRRAADRTAVKLIADRQEVLS